MDKKRLLELAGMDTSSLVEEVDVDAEEEKMMVELKPLKKQLDAIMKKYPHASYDDVLDWLKS